MRHGKKFNHLSRKSSHRKALLANMASSLIKHKRITTTTAKAKELRKYIEPLITKSKENTTHNRRTVFSYLQDKNAVTELFGDVATKVANRPGGYTRVLKIGNRLGDNADMAIIELVDYNELMLAAKGEKKAGTKTRRSRRGGGGAKKADAPAPEAKVEETPVEEVEDKVEDAPVEATEAKKESPKAEEAKEEAPAEEAPEAKAEEPAADEPKEEPKAEDSDEEKEKKD